MKLSGNNKIRISIVGTRGIPARYGGFETFVENLVPFLTGSFDITVFCSTFNNFEQLSEYMGCNLEYIPFKANGLQSVIYDIISIWKSVRKFDKTLVLGVSGGIIMPFLMKHKNKIFLNIGGLDWKRSKWNYLTRKFLKFSEFLAVRNSGTLISDNQGIHDYILKKFGLESIVIAYGGDHVKRCESTEDDLKRYKFLGKKYAIAVSRVQKDNNVEMILDAFTYKPPFPIVFIGDWNSSHYGIKIRNKFVSCPSVVLLDPIYVGRELDLLRSNSLLYIHGHSSGGTNPSLVEAMNLGLPVVAFSSIYNRFTTGKKALYFNSADDLISLLRLNGSEKLIEIGNSMKEISAKLYTWKSVADKYSVLLNG